MANELRTTPEEQRDLLESFFGKENLEKSEAPRKTKEEVEKEIFKEQEKTPAQKLEEDKGSKYFMRGKTVSDKPRRKRRTPSEGPGAGGEVKTTKMSPEEKEKYFPGGAKPEKFETYEQPLSYDVTVWYQDKNDTFYDQNLGKDVPVEHEAIINVPPAPPNIGAPDSFAKKIVDIIETTQKTPETYGKASNGKTVVVSPEVSARDNMNQKLKQLEKMINGVYPNEPPVSLRLPQGRILKGEKWSVTYTPKVAFFCLSPSEETAIKVAIRNEQTKEIDVCPVCGMEKECDGEKHICKQCEV